MGGVIGKSVSRFVNNRNQFHYQRRSLFSEELYVIVHLEFTNILLFFRFFLLNTLTKTRSKLSCQVILSSRDWVFSLRDSLLLCSGGQNLSLVNVVGDRFLRSSIQRLIESVTREEPVRNNQRQNLLCIPHHTLSSLFDE
jgi:hypothetical protein